MPQRADAPGSAAHAPPDQLSRRAGIDPPLLFLESCPRYTRYVVCHIRPFLKGRICEFGSGGGRVTRYLAGSEHVTAVESDGALHMSALQQSAHQININHVYCSLDDCPNDQVPGSAYDTVLCIDRLARIEYDITALEIMGELLTAGGNVVVVVPAVRALFGPLDRARGRLRRYTRRILADAFDQAGLQIRRHFFFNFPGVAAWWWLNRLRGRDRLFHRYSALIERAVPIIENLERLAKPPIGLSLVMVGKRA